MGFSITTKELKKTYENFSLNVSINVPEGTIVGLIGENGAGKSTFLKLIMGLIKKDGGSFTILNHENLDENRKILEDIGVVIDDNVIPENLNITQVNTIMSELYTTWDEKNFIN